MAANTIRFVLNGEVVSADVTDPTRTVLQFLREDLRLTGTKEGCAEGDCGACTVVVDGRPINACIQFLPTIDGKELITVEGLRGADGDLHPVQRAMVEEHGSQCGFCTPGFVMSLYALYCSNDAPTRREIDDALAGNLCRCTGYRPIVAAARTMCDSKEKQNVSAGDDVMREVRRTEDLAIEYGGRHFFAPRDVETFADLLERYPDATILAGGTDIGLWVTKQYRELGTVIYTGHVAGMSTLEKSATHLEIGAAVTLSDAIPAIVDEYPGLDEMFRRFASPPIRNAGTLGGNVANGSPIGDSMPALMVLGATLLLRKGRHERELALEDFYHAYQVNDLQPGEFVVRIRVPLAEEGVVVSSQKWSKRFDQDISAVCTAYRLELNGDTVAGFRMACGGLAPTIKRAAACEAALIDAPWTAATTEAGCAALAQDFSPITDARATADIRLLAVQNLLRRFYLETTGEAPETVYTYGRQGSR